jgi:O-antigen ligase
MRLTRPSSGQVEAQAEVAPTPVLPRGARLPVIALLLLVLLTVIIIRVTDGSLVLSLAPGLLALLLGAIWLLPLRVTMMVLLAAAWIIEAEGDVFADGVLQTPWAVIGRILWGKLNLVVPVPQLVITGFDLLALLLFTVIVHRRIRGITLDREGWVEQASPIATFAIVSLLGVLWMGLFGLATGGQFRFVLWQSIKWLYVPLIYALMLQAIRGPQDGWLVGKVVLGAGVVRSVEAIVIRWMNPNIEKVTFATTHHDSVLFVTCVAILIAGLLELRSRRWVKASALLLPLYLYAMVANNRRLAWVELVFVLALFWLVTPWRPLKRRAARVFVAGALPFLIYVAVGWGSWSPIFAPVTMIRSVVDSKSDASSYWRDLENLNLVETFKPNPLLGAGFGHPMVEKVKLPDITADYELEPYVPHNSVLGIWAFGGLVGFALLWMLFPVGAFFSARAYRWARTPELRAMALGALAVQTCYVFQGYGDLGFGAWGPVFTVAASYVLVGKICVASGGWYAPRAGRARSPDQAGPAAPAIPPGREW